MKVILLGDLHAGARRGDLDFSRYFNKFFEDVLYPYMLDNGINTIIQAGDYFDDQTSIDTAAWQLCKPVWVDQLRNYGFKMHVLVGNHDIAFKNTLRVNSPSLFLSEYKDCINVISEPTTLDLDGYLFDVVPWICQENKEQVLEFMKKQKGSALIGHFAIAGFPMYKNGTIDKRGLSISLFEHYPFVFSGHFHTASVSGNIQYLGVPYEITWSDFDDPKGFYVFDTESQTVDFVRNPHTMFEKIEYKEGMDIPDSLDNKIVRLVVKDRGNIKKYNIALENFEKLNTKELIVTEQYTDTSKVESVDTTTIDWTTDTTAYIKLVVENTETDLNKDSVVAYMSDLYNRSISL